MGEAKKPVSSRKKTGDTSPVSESGGFMICACQLPHDWREGEGTPPRLHSKVPRERTPTLRFLVQSRTPISVEKHHQRGGGGWGRYPFTKNAATQSGGWQPRVLKAMIGGGRVPPVCHAPENGFLEEHVTSARIFLVHPWSTPPLWMGGCAKSESRKHEMRIHGKEARPFLWH